MPAPPRDAVIDLDSVVVRFGSGRRQDLRSLVLNAVTRRNRSTGPKEVCCALDKLDLTARDGEIFEEGFVVEKSLFHGLEGLNFPLISNKQDLYIIIHAC